ncbi:purine permease 3-like isoform X1 [Triticum urartu]|nr:purine permease 3-like isoform X1 [Triticum urartu]XP_048530595.1 purine permease 3-like isoform X1 [Triticum urartu]
MEIEATPLSPQQQAYNGGGSEQRAGASAKPLYRNPVVVVNFLLMAVGTVSGPLLFRAYFLHGGSRKWLTCLLQTAAWPLLLPPLCVSFFSRRRRQREESATEAAPLSLMSGRLLAATVAIGLVIGVIDFLYAYGLAYLPVSTSSILVSTQLAFTAVFALVVMRHRFTAFSVNAVVLLVVGAAMLGLNGGGDRPAGVSRAQYYAGFAMTLGSAAMYGLVLPLMELSQAQHAARAGAPVTYTLVLEIQMVIGITATAFSAVGMLVNREFHEIPDEARRFDLGEAGYYFMLVSSATAFQCYFIGTIGAIFYGSALLAGVIMTLLISVTEVFAILFFHEPFNGTKGVALAISIWGFISYFYGEIQTNKQQSNMSTDKEHLDP